MARLRARGNLTCFYCGKRSTIKFDGTIRDFLCLHCDATNYLDENGDITDPPVAHTTFAVEPAQYATSRSHSPPQVGSQSDSIFCAQCLKNQHLFTASLAQYLPDDPSHPEYERLEKNYYNYRKKLERLYPQICAECEPKVLAQVDRAGYTARTDHLRRMMDKSRQQRTTPKQWSPLDTTDRLGKWLWRGGLVLQLLWHLAVISDSIAVATPGPLRDPDEAPTWLVLFLGRIAEFLPDSQLLISWSVVASVLSVWWNPRFVQVFRGFSKHVLGLSQWYIFQALVVGLRVAGRRATELAANAEVSKNAQLSLHGLLALAMVVFYVKAMKLVRIDTTPLFQTTPSPLPSPLRATTAEKRTRREEPQSLASMLDEIMQQPSTNSVMEIPTRPSRSPTGQLSPVNSFQMTTPAVPNRGMSTLGLNESPTPVHYSEEMDWSPTQSKHRAFNDFGPPGREKEGFNNSPTNVEAGTFWYKVPPAPKPPLHKLVDASRPAMREKPVEKETVFFPGRKTFQPSQNKNVTPALPKPKVAFAQPAFFADRATASTTSNDPRNTLADLLNSSFSIRGNDDSEDENSPIGGRDHPIELQLNLVAKAETGNFFDVLLLLALLSTWVYVTSYEDLPPFTRDLMLGTVGLTTIVGIHMARAAILDLNAGKGPYGMLVGNAALSLCEVIGCGMLLVQVWTAQDAYSLGQFSTPGLVTLSVMLAHGMVACFAPRLA